MTSTAKLAFKFAAIVAFGGFVFGLDVALIAGANAYYVKEFGIDENQLGNVVSAAGLGAIVALLFIGYLCNIIGRKGALIVIASLYSISSIASALAPSYETLVAARFLGGLAFTSLSLSSMYIGEIAPSNMRGKLVAMNQLMIVIGINAAFFINYFLQDTVQSGASWAIDLGLDENTWRWMLGMEIIPTIIWLIALVGIPESPRWLVSKGKLDQAREVLARLSPADQVNAQIQHIEDSSAHAAHKAPSAVEQFTDMLDIRVRKAMVIGFIFAIVQPVSGINAIFGYANMVFEQSGIGSGSAFEQTIIMGITSLVFTIIALALIDRIGRRPLVIIGLTWAAASLLLCSWIFSNASYQINASSVSTLMQTLPDINLDALEALVGIQFDSDVEFKAALATHFGEDYARHNASVFIETAVTINAIAVLICILGFIGAFHLSIGPIMWIIFSEIVPIHIRGMAIPTFALVTSLLNWVVQKFFPWQLVNQGAAEIFLFYGSTAAIGLVLLSYFLPETKNKTIEEIEAELSGKHYSNAS